VVLVIGWDGQPEGAQARETNTIIMRSHADPLNYSKCLDKLNVVQVVEYYLLVVFLLCWQSGDMLQPARDIGDQ